MDVERNDELILTLGGAVKATDDGHLTGYLVRFTDEETPDSTGDFFTSDTAFDLDNVVKVPLYFHHRLPLTAKGGKVVRVKEQIGEGTLSVDDEGVLIDAILFNHSKYRSAILKAHKSLGWSSGTASHLIEKEKVGKSWWIKTWPLGLDASLTPTPAEIKNMSEVKCEIDLPEDVAEGLTVATSVQVKTETTTQVKDTQMEANEITAAVQAALKAEREAEAKVKAEADAVQAKIDAGIKAGLENKKAVNRSANLNVKTEKGDDAYKAMAHFMRTGDNGGLRANPDYRHIDPNDPVFDTKELKALKTDYEIMGAANQGAELIPTEIINKIYELRTNLSIPRAAGAEVRQVSTRTIWAPVEVAPTVWPVVTNESTALTLPQATFLDKKIIPIQTYGKAIYMANDTLQDAVADPVAWYASWVGRGLALTENAEMLVGDGSANCLGVHVVTTGHTAGVTAASATAITAAEVTALYFSLPSEYRDNVAWTMTGAVEGAIRGLQSDGFNFQLNPAGNGGFPQGVGWLVAPNARVFNSSSCPAATANLIPIVVGNWQAGYLICESKAMTIFRDPYSRALYNQVAFHCTARFGGITRDVLAFRGLTMASA